MGRIHLLLVLFIGISSSVISIVQASINSNLVNSEVTRNIDLSSQIAKSSLTLRFENTGDPPVTSFYVPIDASLSEKLAHISASVSVTVVFPVKEF